MFGVFEEVGYLFERVELRTSHIPPAVEMKHFQCAEHDVSLQYLSCLLEPHPNVGIF